MHPKPRRDLISMALQRHAASQGMLFRHIPQECRTG